MHDKIVAGPIGDAITLMLVNSARQCAYIPIKYTTSAVTRIAFPTCVYI